MTTPLDRPPAWVSDAIFYQIFPDRFARSLGTKPTGSNTGIRRRRRTDTRAAICSASSNSSTTSSTSGINAIYLNPIFQSGCNHRYHTHDYFTVDPLLGGNDALRELLDACHASWHPDHARRRVQPRQPRLLPVQRHPRERAHSPWIDWFHVDGWPLSPTTPKPANYGVVGHQGPAQVQHRQPAGPGVPHAGRRVLDASTASTAGDSTFPRRSQTPGFWEEFRSGCVPSIPTPTSSARSGRTPPSTWRPAPASTRR